MKLTNGDFKFEFKDTSVTTDSITDNEVYRTYTFYIKAPASETTASIVLGLGGKDKSNQAIAGKVYLKDIVLEDISNIDYDEMVADLADDENLIDDCTMRADLSTTDAADDNTEDDTTDDETATDTNVNNGGGLEWWLIPSILLVVAVVIAIVGSFIRKRIESRPKKINVSKQSSYDRRFVKTDDDTVTDTDKTDADVKDTFESFDDTVTEIDSKNITETAKTETAEETKVADDAQDVVEEKTAETAEESEKPAEEKADETAAADESEKAEPKAEEKKKVIKPADGFVDDFED